MTAKSGQQTSIPQEVPSDRVYRRRLTVEQLIADQGVQPLKDIESLRVDLWDTDEEFDEFMEHLQESRKEI